MQIRLKFLLIRIVTATGLIMLTGIWLIKQFQPMQSGANRGWSPVQIVMHQEYFAVGLAFGIALGGLWAIAIQLVVEKGMKAPQHSNASALVGMGFFALIGIFLGSLGIRREKPLHVGARRSADTLPNPG